MMAKHKPIPEPILSQEILDQLAEIGHRPYEELTSAQQELLRTLPVPGVGLPPPTAEEIIAAGGKWHYTIPHTNISFGIDHNMMEA